MIVIGKTSATKVRDGIYTALLGELKITGNKVFIPFYKRVDCYLQYTNITEDLLSRLKRVNRESNDILTYNVSNNEIIGISFPENINKKDNLKSSSKPNKVATTKKEKVNNNLEKKKSPNELEPKKDSNRIVKKKRKRIISIIVNSEDMIFDDGFITLALIGDSKKYPFPESKSLYHLLNYNNCRYEIEVKLKGGEIFNRKSILNYIEGLVSGEIYNYKSPLPAPKLDVPANHKDGNLTTNKTKPNDSIRKSINNTTNGTKEIKNDKKNNSHILETGKVEQIDVMSSKDDNDWSNIRFQKGMVELNFASKVYKFACVKAKQEYNYIKTFYQTHHYNFTINLRNNTPVGVTIPDNLFDFLELGSLIYKMKKSRDMRDLWKVKKLTDSLSSRAIEIFRFFNKDKSYYFNKLSEMHDEEFKIRVVWEPNIWSGSSYNIHLTFLFTYLHNATYCLFWESTETSTATYIFKFTSLEKYNLGVEHFVTCISDINCYKGRLALRRGNKYLENVNFISHSSFLSQGIDYDWNAKVKRAILSRL